MNPSKSLFSALGACPTYRAASEKAPQRGQFLPDLPPHSGAMGQKDGEKWAAAALLQPAFDQSDRLLGVSRFVAAATSLLLVTGLALPGAGAQALSSPVPGVAPAPKPAIPHGTGAGEHSPLSPIAPLKPREDVVAWSLLTDIGTKVDVRRIVPVYTPDVLALNQKKVRLQGFMMPLQAGENQQHFILSSVPLTCQFCTPGGPESMVEVRAAKPVKYTQNAVAVEGQFWVLDKDPQGLYYRLTDAVSVR